MSSVASTRDLVGTGQVNWGNIKATIANLPPPIAFVSAAPSAPVEQLVDPSLLSQSVHHAQPTGPTATPHVSTSQPTEPGAHFHTGGQPTGPAALLVPPIQPTGPVHTVATPIQATGPAAGPTQLTGSVATSAAPIQAAGPVVVSIPFAQPTGSAVQQAVASQPAGSTTTLPPTNQPTGPAPFPVPATTPADPAVPVNQMVPAAPPPLPGRPSNKRKHDNDSANSSKRSKQDGQPDSEDDVSPQPVRTKPAPKRAKKDPSAPKAPRKPRKVKTPELVDDPETMAVGEPDTDENAAPDNVNEIWQVRYKHKKCDMIYDATATLGDNRCSACVYKAVEVCWAVKGLSCIPCKLAKRACNLERESKPVGRACPKPQGISTVPVAPGTADEPRGKLFSYSSPTVLLTSC